MENQILMGNCTDIMNTLADKSIPLILTDIPYDVVTKNGTKRAKYSGQLRKLDKEHADVLEFDLDVFMQHCVRICSGSVYIFCATEQASFIRSFLVNSGFTTRLCIWEKTNPSPVNGQHLWLSGVEICIFGRIKGATFNEHCKNTVWRYPVGRSKIHPTEKPLKLFEYLINASSKEGDIVFDPCIGSGTTAIAALKTGRKYIGIENHASTYASCMNRLNGYANTENVSGKLK